MSIYILEDNVFQAKYLSDMITKLLNSELYVPSSMKPQIFYKPSDLVETVSTSGESFNLYFLYLKIKSDATAGFTTGKRIRQMEEKPLICFVTSYPSLALSSYDYGISGYAYIVKDSPQEKFEAQIKDCLTAYLDKSSPVEEDLFIFDSKHIRVSCPFNELLFITPISPHKLLIKTINKDIYAHGSLKDFDYHDNRLVRCHQSFIINIVNVKFFNKRNKEAVITENILIPISRKKNREFMQALNEHREKMKLE